MHRQDTDASMLTTDLDPDYICVVNDSKIPQQFKGKTFKFKKWAPCMILAYSSRVASEMRLYMCSISFSTPVNEDDYLLTPDRIHIHNLEFVTVTLSDKREQDNDGQVHNLGTLQSKATTFFPFVSLERRDDDMEAFRYDYFSFPTDPLTTASDTLVQHASSHSDTAHDGESMQSIFFI